MAIPRAPRRSPPIHTPPIAPHGNPVAPFHLNTTCIKNDPGHQWQAMHDQIDGGKMDGYATVAGAFTGTDGWFALGYYDQRDLPFYYWLASTPCSTSSAPASR